MKHIKSVSGKTKSMTFDYKWRVFLSANIMKYVGIIQSRFKTYLVKNYRKGHRVKISVPSLIANDCNRHLELLALFDSITASFRESRGIFKTTQYYSFQRKNCKTKKNALRKIKKYLHLYESIKKHGYNRKMGTPIVLSTEGARLNGSHRAAILYHLNTPEVTVVLIDWSKMLNPKSLKQIRKHLKKQRRKYI
jgi:hypothetical protein